jgi:EAL domain-containing protein (putative c-di-GMP-specific phosphodiesterase class I)/GGDEF domain-containing protein
MTPDASAYEQEFERSRLKELGRYAMTFDEPEPAFDSAVDLLCHLCSVPLGGISVVDSDTVWLKARHGVELSRVARSVSFCTLAIQSGEDLFRVPDTALDPRFQSHPMVREAPHVRYYAAVPLFGQSGFAIGTLWVMDVKPNALDKRGEDALRMIASHVVTLLDARYLSDRLRLYNRAGFLRQMRDRMMGVSRNESVVGCVNIRGLRTINDTYGHAAGDLAIEEVARHLRAWRDEAQGSKVSSPVAANLEGGNFALMVAGAGARANVARLVDSLRRCAIKLNGQWIQVITTVSLIDCRGEAPDAPAVLDRALLIVREAPNSGICVLHDKGTTTAGSDEGLAVDLRAALAGQPSGGRLETQFQPIFDVAQGGLAGFEALLRWEHPTLGAVPPSRFLPLAERIGVLYQLDLYSFSSMCRVLAAWTDAGRAPPGMSINIARATVLAPSLGEALLAVAGEYGLSPRGIELEITAAGLVDPESLVDRVVALRSAGFSIAIDDFGTGMSNLDSLNTLPCDTLKIDRRFVGGLAFDGKAAGLYRLLIGIAGVLGVRLICIGAQTRDDTEWLAANGARLIQGWYFAGALSAEDAGRLLDRTMPDAEPLPSSSPVELHHWINRVSA